MLDSVEQFSEIRLLELLVHEGQAVDRMMLRGILLEG